MSYHRIYSTTLSITGAGAYAAGDEVSTNVTAASTQRAVFNMEGMESGRILGLGFAYVSATSVVTANDQEILLFRTGDAPAAVGDNVSHPITALQRLKALAEFRFDDGGWVNQLGAVGTGTSCFQYALAQGSIGLATPVLQTAAPAGRVFDFSGTKITERTITVVWRALAAWDPSNEAQTFAWVLDVEV